MYNQTNKPTNPLPHKTNKQTKPQNLTREKDSVNDANLAPCTVDSKLTLQLSFLLKDLRVPETHANRSGNGNKMQEKGQPVPFCLAVGQFHGLTGIGRVCMWFQSAVLDVFLH